MQGLNIQLRSLQLSNSLYNQNDTIRISITTYPEKNKQAFTINAKQMYKAHHLFTANITEQTTKVVFIFRKKNYLQGDPIIATASISSNEFPKLQNDTRNDQIKSINIYEHIKISPKVNGISSIKPKTVGEMKVQLSLCEAFQAQVYQEKNKVIRTHNGAGYFRMNVLNNKENQNYKENNMLLDENGFY